MNLQYLSSMDKAASIDSACYDFSTLQAHHGGPMHGNPTPSGMTPMTGRGSDGGVGMLNPMAQGFSEMLK